jgi:5-methylcytosine-specific restriction endonuclease McrA
MNKKEFSCKVCKRRTIYGNSFHRMCTVCNQQRLIDVNSQKKQFTDTGVKNRWNIPASGRRTGRTYEHKTTGEAEMFMQIWETRSHVCTNCWESLGDEPRTFYFAHIKPKSTHPQLRLKPENIRLLCFECHRLYDAGTREQFNKRTYQNK